MLLCLNCDCFWILSLVILELLVNEGVLVGGRILFDLYLAIEVEVEEEEANDSVVDLLILRS